MHYAAELRMAGYVLALAWPALAAAQSVALEIRTLQGEGAVQPAGRRVVAPLSVLVTDEIGRPVAGAAVTFRLPEEGPGGVFASGLKTEVMRTGPDGRATVHEIRWNRMAGPVRIRVTAVHGEARAGTIVHQYLSSSAPPAGQGLTRSSGRRWVKLAAMAAGAAALGFTIGYVRESQGRAVGSPTPPVKIGTPVIVVGRP